MRSKCKHLNDDGLCGVATRLAGVPVQSHESTCSFCVASSNPMDENDVTRGLAAAKLIVLKKALPGSLSNIRGVKSCSGKCVWVWSEQLMTWIEDSNNCTFANPECHCENAPPYNGEFDGQMEYTGSCEPK